MSHLVSLKNLNAALVATASLCAAGAHAASYETEIAPGAIVTWENTEWQGGEPGAVPGAGDDAAINRAGGNNTNLGITAANQSIRNLSYTGGANQLRINNAVSGTASALNVTGELDIKEGLLIFNKQGSGAMFHVEANQLTVRDGAIAQIGMNNAGISLTSQQTTVEQGGTLQVGWSPTGAVHFGALHNEGLLNLGATSTNGGTYDVHVSSLSGTASSSVSTAGGTANVRPTLVIGSTSSGTTTYHGTISNGVGVVSLRKTDSNAQVLTAANTYSGGTLIEGGVLAVENTEGSGLGSGEVLVAAGGTLAGKGIVRSQEAITVEAGGRIAPGILEGFATLRLDGADSDVTLIMEENSSFFFNLGIGNFSDGIEFLNYNSGDLILLGEGIGIELGEVHEGVFTLFSFKDSDANAVASGLTSGLFIANSDLAYNYDLIYNNDSSQADYGTIMLRVEAAVPEPGSVALIIGGLSGALVLFARRFGKRGQS